MKNLILILALAVALVLSATPLSAQTTTTQTSLSAAVTNGFATNVVVASTSGFSASTQTVTYYLFVDGEQMKVNTVNTATGSIGVSRAVNATRATSHPSGAVVWFGPAGASPFVSQNPFPGTSCTATDYQYLPLINMNTGQVIQCRNSRFTTGDSGISGIADANFTASLGDYIIEYTSITAARTVTLPTPVAGMRGKVYIVKNTSTVGTNTIWVTPLKQSGATVDSLLCAFAAASNCSGPVTVVQGAVVGPQAASFPAGRYFTDGVSWFAF